MLEGLLGFLNIEEQVRERITDTLEAVAEEKGFNYKDFMFLIRPMNEKFEFKIYVGKLNEHGVLTGLVNDEDGSPREITVKDVVGSSD